MHTALKTKNLVSSDAIGIRATLVELQNGKEDFQYGLHAVPTTSGFSGAIERSDFLAYLGFRRSQCPFMNGECYCRPVGKDFDVQGFVVAFDTAFRDIQAAEQHLNHCGLRLDHPEGIGFFWGKPSQSRSHGNGYGRGDGHRAAKSEVLKKSEDDSFSFIFSWLEGNGVKGWTTHYRPKHPPLSPELQSVFAFFHLERFDSCPEFEFDQCYWRALDFEGQGAFDSNAGVAHGYFDAHKENFSKGIERLLSSSSLIEKFGMAFIALSPPDQRRTEDIARRIFQPTASLRPTLPDRFDLAISFAGTERPLAQELAQRVKKAGFEVFYDDFYPETLWGKDLVVFFDDIYRKRSRHCVIFVSREYENRMWTNHERRSAQARWLKDKGSDYILPVKVDDIELPGMPDTVGYLSMKERTISEIADLLVKKLIALN